MKFARQIIFGFYLIGFVEGAFAQTTVTTTGGTANTVPMFSGSSTLTNSIITQSGSNVGIGTTNPSATLEVLGNVMVGNPSPNCNSPSGIQFYSGSSNILIDCGSNIYLLSGATINSSGQPTAQTVSPSGLWVQNNGFFFQGDTGQTAGSPYTPTTRLSILSSGNVGVGTIAPIRPLTVVGEASIVPGAGNGSTAYLDVSDATGSNGGNYSLNIRGLASNGSVGVNLANINLAAGNVNLGGTLTFANGSVQQTAYTPQAANVDSALSYANGTLQVAGNIEIGSSSPNCDSPTGLFYYGAISNILLDCNQNVYLLSGMTINSSGQSVAQTAAPVGLYAQNDGFHFMADTGKTTGTAYTPSERFTIQSITGNVGIGTTAPGYKLDVAGQIHVSGGIIFPDGNTQSMAWTGSLCGGDYAESIDVSDDRQKYEPGDVLVIDLSIEGKFLKSSEPYSTAVAGIYSTKPGVVGRRQTTAKNPDEIPMAVVGIVPTKVSTENGPIRPGDLLVTSGTPGYAMKGTDRSLLTGAIVGKAMGSLASGSGIIEVLVSLQ